MAFSMRNLELQHERPLPDDDRWALFLDFDGTLVDIAERPDGISVDTRLPGILERLRQRLGGAVAIVSGRPVAFLEQRLGLPGLDMAGLHGLEHRLGGKLAP